MIGLIGHVSKGATYHVFLPDDPGSNPAIGNYYSTHLLLTVCRKDKIKEKEALNDPFSIAYPLASTALILQSLISNLMR